MLLLLCTTLALARNVEPGRLHLVPGKFGEALDAGAAPAVIAGSERFREPPLTIECWVKLPKKEAVNVLVACDPKTSAKHWELAVTAGTGKLAFFVPGSEPSAIVSETPIVDDRWHYIAAIYEPKRVRLFVDGVAVTDQAIAAKPKRNTVPGPLSIGLATDATQAIGCVGLIDDVRLTRGVREIKGVPTEPLPLDPATIGLWRFDQGDVPTADPAWTPRPAVGNAAAWEKETDADWVDERLRRMDTGPTFNATVEYPGWQGSRKSFKATAIKVGDRQQGTILFDRAQLRFAAGWTGGFLQHSNRRFGLLNTPKPIGDIVFSSGIGAGWADTDGEFTSAPPPTAPLPVAWGRYEQLERHGDRTVLVSTVHGRTVRELPWAETLHGETLLQRTLMIHAGERDLRGLVAELPDDAKAGIESWDRGWWVQFEHAGNAYLIWIVAATAIDSVALVGNRLVMTIPPSKAPVSVGEILYWRGTKAQAEKLRTALAERPARSATPACEPNKAAAKAWPTLTTVGELAPDNAPYVIDTLTIPYDNPFKALFFVTGVDFRKDGRIAVCTAHGDVWLVSADPKLTKIVWQRFATGLYQPLGLQVVDDVVHVLERGQLTRLIDRDDDGCADIYENRNNRWHTGGGEHSFDTCLEQAPDGSWFFFKTGDTETPTGGCLLRVTDKNADAEIFATGFRHPIGLGMSPTGIVTGADQEGNWMPATRLDQYKRGGFYGDMRAHHRVVAPTIYDPPLCWMPKEADNSAGGQVWIPEGTFGPLGGRQLHFSYGRCKGYLVLREQVGDVVQGGIADLGWFFLSGSARARFRTADGMLYVVGLRGWQTAARRDGSLQRVRYTGKPLSLPMNLATLPDGLLVTFAQPVDPLSAADARNYRIEQWNYRWSQEYGSARYLPSDPNKEGRVELKVTAAEVQADGVTVRLRTEPITPVMQSQVTFSIKARDGSPLVGTLFHTIHRPGPAR